MGVPCRWHTARVGMPQLRSAAVAIALVIVGSSFPFAGADARTPIESSDILAPITAVAGSRQSLVTVATIRRAASGARAARARGMAARPADLLAVDALRALDPELRADLLLAAFEATGGETPGLGPRVATTSIAARGWTPGRTSGRSARGASEGGTSGSAPLYRRLWKEPPGPWRRTQRVTWYGPGFYGNRTACGQRYSRTILGVAHRTLPCGTLVQFTWHGRTAVVPVIDRGPYGHRDLKFDWSARLACRTFKPRNVDNGCFTRYDVRYRVVGKVNLKKWFKQRAAERRKRRG